MKIRNFAILLALITVVSSVFILASCGKKQDENKGSPVVMTDRDETESTTESPEKTTKWNGKVKTDYGKSETFTEEDIAAAAALIKENLAKWEGSELHKLICVGDESNTKANVAYFNNLYPGKKYVECIEFLTNFHSPKTDDTDDEEYVDWQWWFARAEGGEWELVQNGYI